MPASSRAAYVMTWAAHSRHGDLVDDHGALGLELPPQQVTDAVLAWARSAVWATGPLSTQGSTVEDLIPFPAGLTTLKTPILCPDDTALAAISWLYGDRACTVTTQTWHTTSPAHLRAGLGWIPHTRHTFDMTTHWPTTTPAT